MLGEIAQLVKQFACYIAALEQLIQQQAEEIKVLKERLEKLEPKAKPAKE